MFSILFIIILILLNLLIRNNKRRFAKVKNYIYGLMMLIIGLLIISFILQNRSNSKSKSKRERYQNGGSNKKKVDKLLDMCQLPKNYEATSHCFNDDTHQTCCMLSPETRRKADATRNKIGQVSVDAYLEYLKQNKKPIPTKEELANLDTPWCTCLGSQVCSNYKSNVNNNTNIKFVNNKQNKNIVKNPLAKCEKYLADKFITRSHKTPDVVNSNKRGTDKECSLDLLRKRVKVI